MHGSFKMTQVLMLLALSATVGHLTGRRLGAIAFHYRSNGAPMKGGFLFFVFIGVVCLLNAALISMVLASKYLFLALALALVATYLSLLGFFLGPALDKR